MNSILEYEHYIVEELPQQGRGKFGGYKCLPKLNDSEGKYGTLYKLNIPIKYDVNKELDKTVSNNGLGR